MSLSTSARLKLNLLRTVQTPFVIARFAARWSFYISLCPATFQWLSGFLHLLIVWDLVSAGCGMCFIACDDRMENEATEPHLLLVSGCVVNASACHWFPFAAGE